MRVFGEESLFEVSQYLKAQLEKQEVLSFCVPNPDLGIGCYTGELIQDSNLIHRAWSVWFDLAERLECRFSIPMLYGEHYVCLTFTKLFAVSSSEAHLGKHEKYGAQSEFGRMNKLEESDFLLTYLEALERIKLQAGERVLSLGINTAKEFKVFDYLGLAQELQFTGIDYSETALRKAKEAFPSENYRFIQEDINDIAKLELGQFDLVMALGTLQSPGIDDRMVLRYLVQHCTHKSSRLLFAFPNSTHLGTERSYGARMKNFRQPDLSLVVKDIAYYRKYLHQHKFKVFITGKYYLFITAIPI